MRKRSGGLHCETQQQFIELAQLSQQKCGLYYDDHLNRKKSQLNKARSKKKKQQNQLKPAPKPSLFMDFDFNQDDIQDKQTLIELKKSSNKNLCLNITIICSNPQFQRMQLQSILQETNQSDTFGQELSFKQRIDEVGDKSLSKDKRMNEQRVIDLYIHKIRRGESEVYTAYKFWFVKINSMNSEICATYLNISTELFRINREMDSIHVDLQQHTLNSGKRHAIREVKDSSQMLNEIRMAGSEEQQKREQYSLFSPKYLNNEEQFFNVWNNDQSFEGKR